MMVKGRRMSVVTQHDEDTSDFDNFFISSPSHGRSNVPSPEKPVQRNAANARERARMRVLSKAFTRLKTSLPWVPPDTKLSKLDTLRLATTYIAHLRKVLKDDDSDSDLQIPGNHGKKTNHPITFTWPFTINKPNGNDGSLVSSNQLQPELQEYKHQTTEATTYPNYSPCEYMTMTYSEQPRRNLVGHYLH